MGASHHPRLLLALFVAALGVGASVSCTGDCDATTCEADCDETYDEDVQLAACYDHCAKCGTAEPDDD